MPRMALTSPTIIRAAHGLAKDGGAILVAETPPLDEIPPPNLADTEKGLEVRRKRGRPFAKGNSAASNKGPMLTRITIDPDAPEEVRKIHRRAQTLKAKRERELSVQHGGMILSTGVKTELISWARAQAWADHYSRLGDAKQALLFAEKASGHNLKAIGIAEREAKADQHNIITDPLGLTR